PLLRCASRADQGDRRDARVGHARAVAERVAARPAHVLRLLALPPAAAVELMLLEPVETLLDPIAQGLRGDGGRPDGANLNDAPGLHDRGLRLLPRAGDPGPDPAQSNDQRHG